MPVVLWRVARSCGCAAHREVRAAGCGTYSSPNSHAGVARTDPQQSSAECPRLSANCQDRLRPPECFQNTGKMTGFQEKTTERRMFYAAVRRYRLRLVACCKS